MNSPVLFYQSRLNRVVPVVLILLPILLLLADIGRVPVLLNGCGRGEGAITLRELAEKQLMRQGSYKGHRFYMSLDAVQDSQYLSYLRTTPTALIIGIDHDNPSQSSWGGYTRAVLRKLGAVSPQDEAMLRSVVLGKEPDSGQLLVQPLHIPNASFSNFPINYLYIIGIKTQGNGDVQTIKQQTDILERGLRAAIARAGEDRISNLIISSVSVDPNDRANVGFRDFYPLVLAAFEPLGNRADVYLSIYQYWNDEYRAAAIAAVKESWVQACRNSQKESLLVHEQVRLILASLFICLLVCARFVPINFKNFLIITTSFVGLGLGSFAVVQSFLQDWNPGSRLTAHLIVLIGAACLFPVLPRWNPKDMFDKKQDGHE